MERYSEYKDSGVKWLGEIPSHWKVEPFGKHFSFRKGLPITKANLIDSGEAVISYGQIHAKENLGTTLSESLVRYVSRDYLKSHPQCLLTKDDFVFADTSEDIGGSGNFVYNDFPANIFAGYHTIVAKQSGLYNPSYYAYLFKSECWRNHVRSLVNGVKVYSIGRKQLKSNFLLFPSYKEQDAIVRYLDAATSKIDKAIAMQQKMIDLLNERKQIIIQNAVTKGLDENVEMKDSGVEWTEFFPNSWSIKKVKYIFEFISTKEVASNRTFNIALENIVAHSGNYIDTNSEYEAAGVSFRKNDILFGKLRPYLAKVHLCERTGIALGDIFVLRPLSGFDSSFLRYLLISERFIQYVDSSTYGAKMPRANWDFIGNIYVAYPTLDEQRDISKYLDKEMQKFDSAISNCQRQITLLQERKQIIINEVVTGKVKVL